ncbi:MAG: serine/threonine protein kinase [Gammaproteobacteria bacterium]|nr:serine/threonine protein kinase [Gammaproteobacteria bacterium]MDH5799557.1 serine/threonine protein kinase [Gammaproteobacteria bacterium]
MSEKPHSLPPGTTLAPFVVEKTLSAGGFSIVYLAINQDNKERVVIKEYLPQKMARRDTDGSVILNGAEFTDAYAEGRKLFHHEANALRKLHHPNIVHVTHFFEANGTLYMVMDYKPGTNLQNFIKKGGGGLSQKVILTLFPPLLDGLRVVHEAHMLHLDIKPGNIHVQPGGAPLLLDFGAVHRTQMSRQFQPRSVITDGFSPPEQYKKNGYIGPWTDIYAVGATIRACMDGCPPPSANLRKEKDTLKPAAQAYAKKYSASLLQAVDWAMELDALLRPQSIDEYMELFEKAAIETTPEPKKGMLNRLFGRKTG